jgi:toxin CptA
VSSRIELNLLPSATAGLLASVPWLALAGFTALAGLLGWPLLLLFLPILAGLAWHSFRGCGLLRGKTAVVGLWADHSGLFCRCGDGRVMPVTVDSSSCVGSRFLALKLRPTGATSGTLFTLIISDLGPLRANTPADDIRRLTMWLRLGYPHPA